MLAITAIAVTLSSDQALVIYSGGIVDIPSDDKDVQDLIPEDEEDEIMHEDIADEVYEQETIQVFEVHDGHDQPAKASTSFSSPSMEDIISHVIVAFKPILEAGFNSILQTMGDDDQMVTH